MGCFVGIDIGAVSAKAALLSDERIDALEAPDGAFGAPAATGENSGRLYLSKYRRIRGKPLAAANELLEEVIAAVGVQRVSGVCLTGSGSKLAAAALGVAVVNEFKAIAAALATVYPSTRTVFEMGGETSKYLRLSRNDDGALGIVDYATNGDCAAGTGSFLDQQAGRLQYAIENVGDICLSADRTAQVAGRCSVFAKSDMVHAQQKGYTPPEVLRGLCGAVARNFRMAVVRSHPVETPVVFIGGVGANAAVIGAMREVFGLDPSQMIVPDAFTHIPAIGAAYVARDRGKGTDLSLMDHLRAASDTTGGDFPTTAPLSMDRVVSLRDRVKQYTHNFEGGESIDAWLGLDIGSVSTNVVVIDDAGRVIAEIYTPTQGDPIGVVRDALMEIARKWEDRLIIRGAGTTGSGRELIGQLIGADTINDEITAHKTGATFVGRTMLDGRVPDTIFEIGGQDAKYISLDSGIVVDFTMNEACAAGTGSFLEERAEELDIAIKNDFAELAFSSKAPIRLGERCTVFMERDVNSYLQRGASKADLVAGLAYSVVQNYINRVVRGRKIGDCIFFQGGTAYNDAVAAAFSAVCGKEIIVPPHNGVIGAIGAALLARDKMSIASRSAQTVTDYFGGEPVGDQSDPTEGAYVSQMDQPPSQFATGDMAAEVSESRFRGYDLTQVNYGIREFTCRGCSNNCQIEEFNVEGEKTYWGDKCSDRYRKRTKATSRPVIDDLLSLRTNLLLDESHLTPTPPGAPVVGIPMTMFALDMLPFWRTLLNRCGFATVLSDPTNKTIIQAGTDSVVAEPCFPIIVAHGHVADLLRRDEVDYVLLPNILSAETAWHDNEAHLCPWHQTLPFVCRRSTTLASSAEMFLTPLVRFSQGRDCVRRELAQFFAGMGMENSRRKVADATTAAFSAQDSFKASLLAAGRKALDQLDGENATGIVLVGRPYNVHDAGVNLSVGQKLRDYYGVNCIPLDFLDTDPVDIRDVNENMFWALGRRILAAARIVGDRPNLHIIYITNFKCGPDSFIRHFIVPASGKPYLTLQFDGHSNDAGIMTRCEAYLDSKGILRPWRSGQPALQAT